MVMAVMSAQPPLPLALAEASPLGVAAAIVEDDFGCSCTAIWSMSGMSVTLRGAGWRRCR